MNARIDTEIDAAAYHRRPEISNSFLTSWKRNALSAIYELEHPSEPTEAMIFGTQVHAAVLEPETFRKRFAVLPPLNLRTNADKERKAKIVATMGGEQFVLSQDRHAQIVEINASIQRHSRAKALLASVTQREVSIFWRDEASGVDCRCRMDALGGLILTDLKTTQDASVDAFQASIFNYGYHRQGAMYLRAARAVGLDIKHYSIIAIEKEAPYGCNVFSLSPEAIAQGDREIDDLLKQVSIWKQTGLVPGYAEHVVSASLPEWAWRRIEFEGANDNQ